MYGSGKIIFNDMAIDVYESDICPRGSEKNRIQRPEDWVNRRINELEDWLKKDGE